MGGGLVLQVPSLLVFLLSNETGCVGCGRIGWGAALPLASVPGWGGRIRGSEIGSGD